MTDKTENIIKRVCGELGLTYKQLAEEIGYSEDAIKKAASPIAEISKPMQKAIELLMLNKGLALEVEEHKQLKQLLKKFID